MTECRTYGTSAFNTRTAQRRLLLLDPARGKERLMEIQQHDGVVVDVAGSRQGFAELLREREVLQGRGEAPKAVVFLPSLPPLYRPPGRGGTGQEPSGWGAAARGETCPPRQVGRPPTGGFPTLGA